MPFKGPEDDDRRVIIIERDSGIGWAVAFIVLAIAIGFGIIVFMDQQSMIEYKIEKALQEMEDREFQKDGSTPEHYRTSSHDGGVLDSDMPADVKVPKNDSGAVIPQTAESAKSSAPAEETTAQSSYPVQSATKYSDETKAQ